MAAYENFTVDFPKRIRKLDAQFRNIASGKELEVSYLLMKLSSSFLLPYERIEGTSGVRKHDIQNHQGIRKELELDKKFYESKYCNITTDWGEIHVNNFSAGPSHWFSKSCELDSTVAKILKTLRHSIAHSNLYFGGENKIEHIYFANKEERNNETEKYTVIKCTISAMVVLVDNWIKNLCSLENNPNLIWRLIDEAV